MAEPSPDNAANNETIVLGGAANAADASRHSSSHNALPVGTRMGEFEIIGLIGEGGFGIVYLALDHSLERKVALKEYMPASLASRGADAAVHVRSERHQETFGIGLRSFVNEARLLARFDHPALVKVYRFWEANSTAYMAMPYYDGRTLREVLADNQAPPDEATLRRLLAPVLDALELIHNEQCFHRDIAPDNIMLLRDGRPVLLDFGAARRVISDMTQALTVILKPGYAPIEQYAEMPGMKQGPWTDIYALAAVVYYAIMRRLPPPSVSRIVQDSYEPLAEQAAGRYSHTFLRGIDACLAVKAEQRPQTIAAMRELIGMASTAPTPAPATPPPSDPGATARPSPSPSPATVHRPIAIDQDERRQHARPAESGRSGRRLPVLLGAGALALAGAAAWHFNEPAALPKLATPPSSISAIQEAPIARISEPATSPAATISSPPPVEASVPAPPEPAVSATPAPAQVSSPVAVPANSAPPAPQAAARSVKSSKPALAAKPAEKQDNSGDKAERDYMRQLNQDLEKLMR